MSVPPSGPTPSAHQQHTPPAPTGAPGAATGGAPGPAAAGSSATHVTGGAATPSPKAVGGVRRRVSQLLDRYVRLAPSPDLGQIRPGLWQSNQMPPTAPLAAEERDMLMEQYKIYVEMADRISARRGLANTFFLTINTAVFATVGLFWEHRPAGSPVLLVVPWAMLVVQCLAWFWILRSYRQLNTAKYAVIGAIEERLPASPYWAAEWAALGQGNDPSRYWPVSHVEQWIPALFATGYTAGFLLALLA